MSYESDINNAIMAADDLTALIGDRFSWDIADASTVAPYIVAQTISDGTETDLGGSRNMAMPLIQFSCWAKTKAEARAVMRQFKADMEGIELPGDSGVSLGFSNENSTYDSQTKLFGLIYDYRASVANNNA